MINYASKQQEVKRRDEKLDSVKSNKIINY